jgi:hypothetical protein
MNMTLSKGTVINMAPQAQQLAEGESIRVTVPSSTSLGGVVLVNIQRMTADYFYVSEIK